jgi:hypothetical protein
MTWYFDPDGETVDLYDPDGALVTEDRPFSGSWSDYPTELDPVAVDHILSLSLSTNLSTGFRFLGEWATGDIEQGTPA